MTEVLINPSTGNFDQVGLTQSSADAFYIRLDGTSTTTASIPFAEGLSSSGEFILNGRFSFAKDGNGYDIIVGDQTAGLWDAGVISIYSNQSDPTLRLHVASDDQAIEAWASSTTTKKWSFVLGQTNFSMYYDRVNDLGVFDGRGLSGADTTKAKWFNEITFNDTVNFSGAVNSVNSISIQATSNQLVLQSAGVTGTLTWTPTSSNKTITFPDATGTVALQSPGYVHSKIFYIENPTADDNFPQAYVPVAATVEEVRAVTDTGTVTFNIEKRGTLTPDQAGTDIDSSDFVADATGITDTSFSSGSISADQWLTLTVTSVSSSPTKLWAVITYKYD